MSKNPNISKKTGHAEAANLGRTDLADVIWKSADVLSGAIKPAEYRKVILPMLVLRRIDCLLEPTKDKALAKLKEIAPKNYDPQRFLPDITGFPFWNGSSFTIKKLLDDPNNVKANLEDMVDGFSPNVRRIFEMFGFAATLEKLEGKQRLYLVVKTFASVQMDAERVSAHDMGKAFEELLQKFNEGSPSDEQFTPRDAIHLMVDILFDGDDEALSVPGAIRTMYDQTAGTGGMLSEAEEKVKGLNPQAKLKLFGQELEDETYAICMADMLIRDQDPGNIAMDDTLSRDRHSDQRFDYQLSNPPYGRPWETSREFVEREHAKGAAGRFGPGLPRISDGQMLFMLNALSKMRPFINGEGGGRIGLVHNGSPLFTGDAGSGESEIRRHILEHDYLDAIVALPADMFYNTNIATYLWFMTNRKPKERKGKVMLIDASNMGVLMKKNLGKKRLELSEDCQRRIVEVYHSFKDTEWKDGQAIGGRTRALKAKVLPASHFFYRKVTVERPLRMRFQIDGHVGLIAAAELRSAEHLANGQAQLTQALHDVITLKTDSNFKKLPEAERDTLVAAIHKLRESQLGKVWMSAVDFRDALQAANRDNYNGLKAVPLKAKHIELARKFFGVRDKKAEIVTDDKGLPMPDSDLRDAEYIPFSTIAKAGSVTDGIDAYFDAEVKPHWPDAWINVDVKDKADGQIGLVGCEVNFNREFYVYEAPRSREAIKHDIEAMEKRFMEMLKGVAG